MDGAWVLGGVERTPERRMFLCVVPDRSESTLVRVLNEHIAVGSIIYTDLWKGYCNIDKIFGVQHCTVNHSKYFKDPVTGIHTNTIEGTWAGLKCKISHDVEQKNCLILTLPNKFGVDRTLKIFGKLCLTL